MKNYAKLTSLALTMLLMLPFGAQAQRWFEVEMILFERTDNSQTDVEQFEDDAPMKETRSLPYQASLMGLEGNVSTEQVRAVPTTFIPSVLQGSGRLDSFVLLGGNDLQLTSIRQKLSNHASFRPMLHLGFQMPIDSRRAAIPLHLFAGKNYQDEYSEFADMASPTFPAVWQMEGLIRIYLQQYLFVDADLILRKPGMKEVEIEVNEPKPAQLPAEPAASDSAAPVAELGETEQQADEQSDVVVVVGQDPVEEPSQAATRSGATSEEPYLYSYRLDQLRRLRSGEIHYLDHPQMGVVFQIRRME